jgi:hypothetical protein
MARQFKDNVTQDLWPEGGPPQKEMTEREKGLQKLGDEAAVEFEKDRVQRATQGPIRNTIGKYATKYLADPVFKMISAGNRLRREEDAVILEERKRALGYKKGGSVRGSGCCTKTKKCKMY